MANQAITNVQAVKFSATQDTSQIMAYLHQLQDDNVNLQKDIVTLSQRVSVLEMRVKALSTP